MVINWFQDVVDHGYNRLVRSINYGWICQKCESLQYGSKKKGCKACGQKR